jgi:hypothetical protein
MLLIWLNYPRSLQNISLQFFWRRCRLVIKVQKTQSRQTQKGQKKRRKKNTHSKQLIFNFWFCSSPSSFTWSNYQFHSNSHSSHFIYLKFTLLRTRISFIKPFDSFYKIFKF